MCDGPRLPKCTGAEAELRRRAIRRQCASRTLLWPRRRLRRDPAGSANDDRLKRTSACGSGGLGRWGSQWVPTRRDRLVDPRTEGASWRVARSATSASLAVESALSCPTHLAQQDPTHLSR